jgi:protease IV
MNEPNTPNWERQTLEKLAFAALQEQRRGRLWGIFFKLLTFAYLLVVLFALMGWLHRGPAIASGKHTGLVELKGVIAENTEASADKVTDALRAAFGDSNTQGIVLRINSPGGSPVQAGQINDEIKRLRAKYPKVPLYAVVDDICASGGYYVAVAADKIYVDKASLIGSVGVLMNGFGFNHVMEKLGVDRRLITAGENKGFLDPFSPRNPAHEAYAKQMLGQIHDQFIKVVKEGRGKRLKETPEIFSGLVWNGEQSLKLGLADEFGNADYVAREVIKAEDMVDYTTHETLPERLAKKFGMGAASALVQFADWSRWLR